MSTARPAAVDYGRVASLQYLGNYVRRLRVSMARMMENALDWEHLPHVHASSFAAIDVLEAGPWGWRARALPATAAEDADASDDGDTVASRWQRLELLLDAERHYWATTVLAGPAASIEIHTQATVIAEDEIEVDVRFYSSVEIPDAEVPVYLDVLQQQYALLYDEDDRLMRGRQAALDARVRARNAPTQTRGNTVLVGSLAELARDEPVSVDTAQGRYCVRHYQGRWIAHSAVCPHLLGPLDAGPVAPDGSITCPWHGYRFDVVTGQSLGGRCRALAPAPALLEREGSLYLSVG